MSYKINKNSSSRDIQNFIAEYMQDCNQNRGYQMSFKQDDNYYYALEPWETFSNGVVTDISGTETYLTAQTQKANKSAYETFKSNFSPISDSYFIDEMLNSKGLMSDAVLATRKTAKINLAYNHYETYLTALGITTPTITE